MSRIILLTLLSLMALEPALATDSEKKFQLATLSKTNDPQEQIRAYRNLADLTFDTPEALGYQRRLFEVAKAAGQTDPMMQALTDLSISYLGLEQLDSARYYIALAEKLIPEKEHDIWCSYLSMRLFNAELLSEEAEEAVEQQIVAFQQRDMANESLYAQVAVEYNLGLALFDKTQYDDAIPYLVKALEAANQLPKQYASPYQIQVSRQLSNAYSRTKQPEKSIEVVKQAIESMSSYYQQYLKAERPYYPINDFYITHYASLLSNTRFLPEAEALLYQDLLDGLRKKATSATQKYSCCLGQYNYFLTRKNIGKALAYNDSLIYYGKQVAPYNLPGLYLTNSHLLEMIDRPQAALNSLRESYRLKDSIQQNNMKEQLNKLRVEYDVNRLNYENSQLEIRNKHITIIGLVIILIMVLVICLYLYRHLKQERTMKERIHALKLQAEESEKLKTAFINSICHEIRTPLNGIVGFAELMIDPSIDEETKSTFPLEIRQNTDQLVSLINSMLEVSSLDVSDVKLNCTPVDLTHMCLTDYERANKQYASSPVVCVTDLPNEPLLISTHERYLSMVIEHLLENSYKFTAKGKITLRCVRKGDNVEISVSDTGIGIPVEKREAIFNRFTKLDTYKPGSGLGLYLCQLIVRRLSGKIFVDPDYTPGTRIVVIIPIQ